MRTTKVQISMRIRAVWLVPLLSAAKINRQHCKQTDSNADSIASSVDPDHATPSEGVRSGSALFAQTCLSKNLGSSGYIKYIYTYDTTMQITLSFKPALWLHLYILIPSVSIS